MDDLEGYPSGNLHVIYSKFNTSILVNYNDLIATSLGMMVGRGNYPQMTLFQVNELS